MSITTLLHSHVAFSLPTLTSRRRNAAIIYAVSAPPEQKTPRGRGSGRKNMQSQRTYESEIGLPHGLVALSNDPEGAATCGISEVAFATFENMEYEEDYMKTDTETYNWVIQAHTGAESYDRYIEEVGLTGESKRWVPHIEKTPLDPDTDGFAYSKSMETSFKQRCLRDWRIYHQKLFRTLHNERPAILGVLSKSDYMRAVERLRNIIKDCIKPNTESYNWMVQLYTRAQSHTKGVLHGRKNSLYEASNGLHGSIEMVSNWIKEWSQLNIVKVVGLVACAFLIIPSADAVDALKTCTCLLKECRIELAKCIGNPSCAANIACLQTCNNRPDETECQIKCGDLFENSVVDEFNECAVSRKKCVPRKSDVGEFPVPDPTVLVKSFNIADFTGKWFITSGLNPTFDTFDCQLHEFRIESNKLVGNLTWRIRTPDTAFFTRSAVQKFVQDPLQPGVLYNHDNEYLHYQDDWYILSSKIANEPDDYVFVYYRGRNDAWDGYGGAVVYTRSATLPKSIVPELERAAKSVGRDFSTFIRTDNTCGPEPPLVERIEKTVEEGERTIIKEVEEIEEEVEKVGKTEVTLFQRLLEGFKELRQDEENFLRSLSKEEMELLNELKMEAKEVEKLFGQPLPIRKLR